MPFLGPIPLDVNLFKIPLRVGNFSILRSLNKVIASSILSLYSLLFVKLLYSLRLVINLLVIFTIIYIIYTDNIYLNMFGQKYLNKN